MLDGEPQSDRPAPVVHHHGQRRQGELADEALDRPVVRVVRVPVALDRFVGAPEPEVVGRDDPRDGRERRDQLAIQVAPGRLAVEQEDGIACALVDVVQPVPVLVDVVRPKVPAGQSVEVLVGSTVGLHRPRV
jgi:hypothetical protein